MVFLTLKLFPLANRRVEVLKILTSVQAMTRSRAECVGSWVDTGEFFPGWISYLEQWESEKALHKFLASHVTYDWLLAAMELSAEPPLLQFHSVSAIRGIDLIHEIRSGPNPLSVNRERFEHAKHTSISQTR